MQLHTRSAWSTVLAALGAVALATASGCGKANADPTADTATAAAPILVGSAAAVTAAAMDTNAAVVEQQGDVRLAFDVEPDGNVWVSVKRPDGSAIEPGKATLTVQPADASQPAANVALVPANGALQGNVGALKADLTELRYSIEVAGKALAGVLHLPPGGTRALLAAAPPASDAGAGEAVKGPHGGVVQRVGDDWVEIVGQQSGDEVRVYVLDAEQKPVEVGDRKISLAFGGAQPQYLVLAASPDRLYFSAKLKVKVEPVKLTVVVVHEHDHVVHAALCGYRRGEVVVIDHHPVLAIFVVRGDWVLVGHHHHHDHDDDDDDDDHHHGHGKWKGGKGKGAHINIHIH